MENQVEPTSIESTESEVSSVDGAVDTEERVELNVLNEVVVNDNLSVKFYQKEDGQVLVGITHFKVENEIFLKLETYKAMIEKTKFLGM